MLALYLLLLGALAGLTAYTRNFQRTIVAIGEALDPVAGAAVAPRTQSLRTMALLLGWPVAVGLGMLFVAWWKAVALVVATFLVLVPVIGAFTPRPMSEHYLARIRADLERRLAAGQGVEPLRRILAHLDQLTRARPA